MTTLKTPDEVVVNWGGIKDDHGQSFFPVSELHPSVFITKLVVQLLKEKVPYLLEQLRMFDPNVSKDNPNQMALWPDYKAYLHGESKRLRGRPGKMFKRMFPYASDTQIEALSLWFKDTHIIPDTGLVYKTGTSRKDFRHAYTHDMGPTSDFQNTNRCKYLHCSCMRYEFGSLPCHPAEVYASGDFQIAWLEDSKRLIHARTILYDKEKVKSPIYAVTKYAADELGKHTIEYSFGNFEGGRLLAVEYDRTYVVPYLDGDDSATPTSCGEYLLIDNVHGGICLNQTEGLGEVGSSCNECGDFVGDEDAHFCDGLDGGYCEDCFSELTIYCEYYGECVPRSDDDNEVRTGSGRNNLQSWCAEAISERAFWCEATYQYVSDDYLLGETRTGDTISEFAEGYAYCDFCSYATDDYGMTVDGEVIDLEYAKEHNWVANKEGEYYELQDDEGERDVA